MDTLTTPTCEPPPDMSWWGSLEVKSDRCWCYKFWSRVNEDVDWRKIVGELGGSSGQSWTRRLIPRTEPVVLVHTVRLWSKLWNAYLSALTEEGAELEDARLGFLPPTWARFRPLNSSALLVNGDRLSTAVPPAPLAPPPANCWCARGDDIPQDWQPLRGW